MQSLTAMNPAGAVGAVGVPNPAVVIVYEDVATGLRAKEAFDRVFGRLDSSREYHLVMWEFSVLGFGALRARAVRDAAASDIVCVAAHGEHDLPAGVKEWAERWAKEPMTHRCTMVALLEAVDAELPEDTLLIEFLREVASKRDAEFLLESLDDLGEAGNPVFLSRLAASPRLVMEHVVEPIGRPAFLKDPHARERKFFNPGLSG